MNDTVTDRQAGISMRFVRQWDITPDPAPLRMDGYLEEDGVIRFMVSHDGGKTWEPNGEPVKREDLPTLNLPDAT